MISRIAFCFFNPLFIIHTMGKQCLLGAAAVLTLLSGACGTQNTPKGCTLTGHVSMPEYDMAYLADLDRHRVDSTALDGGDFRFAVADSVSRPYALLLQLVDREEPLNQMDLPVMVENGEVRIALGEYIRITGTPLNDAVSFTSEVATVYLRTSSLLPSDQAEKFTPSTGWAMSVNSSL